MAAKWSRNRARSWRGAFIAASALLAASTAHATTPEYADLVVEFFDGGNGSLAGPQGGVFPPPASSPTAVSLSVVLADDPGGTSDYLSLPLGSFVTVGFIDENIVDGPGDDILVSEVGSASEIADVYVSAGYSTNPADFTFLGQATANVVTAFDLSSIAFVGPVRSVKVVGLDTGGFPNAPGFDLANVRALNQDVPVVPVCFADRIVEFFDAGNGTLAGPQGGIFPPPAVVPTAVSLDVVLGDDPGATFDYLSLPTGSFVTVGFADRSIFDGPGADLFVTEVGTANETGDVYVSDAFSTNPARFTFLGTATANVTTAFDLAAVGYTGAVRAVKIVGLDIGGTPGAPGFDVANVQALNCETAPPIALPAAGPVGLFLLASALLALGWAMRSRVWRHRLGALAILLLVVSSDARAEVPAFPGAEGFGAATVGGRGGVVLKVTRLEDDNNPGSLRWALKRTEPRIVVFETGGTFELNSPIQINSPFITVAGQTAPGGGVLIRNQPNANPTFPTLRIETHDVVLRYLRIRSGASPPNPGCSGSACNTDEQDAIAIGLNTGSPTHGIMLDHLSLGWANDELIGASLATDTTVQWSLFGEALMYAPDVPNSDAYGKGMLLGGNQSAQGHRAGRVSIHHNLFVHNPRRSPETDTSCAPLAAPDTCVVEVVNNLVYNWLKTGINFSNIHGAHYSNIVGNTIKPGVNVSMSGVIPFRGIQLNDHGLINGTALEVFFSGNEWEGPTGTVGISEPTCSVQQVGGGNLPCSDFAMDYRATARFAAAPITEQTAAQARTLVLDEVGAFRSLDGTGGWRETQDTADESVIEHFENGTGALLTDPSLPLPFPTLAAGTPYPDTDDDGMPDAWETAFGLDPLVAAIPGEDSDGDGYDDIEEYLNATDPLRSQVLPGLSRTGLVLLSMALLVGAALLRARSITRAA